MWIPGPKLTQVFASRWKALFWAASILVSAYFFIPKQGAHDDSDNAQAMSMASRFLPGDAVSTATPLSPWAADSAAS
jgi:hypothetical protein